MGRMAGRGKSGPLQILGGLFVMLGLLSAPAQAQEREPNNTCATAQNFGAKALPVALSAALNVSADGRGDVDFFRVTLTPGTPIQIDMQGMSSGQGTLQDPSLGVFDANCNFLGRNEDAGSLDSKVRIVVPTGGTIVIAASACCDVAFTGSHGQSGSYRLMIAPIEDAGVRGRLVDAVTRAPLDGANGSYPRVAIEQCDSETPTAFCFPIASFLQPDSSGEFVYPTYLYQDPLNAGQIYRLVATANGYFPSKQFFTATARQTVDLGDIAMALVPVIGSIRARLVDDVSLAPLKGSSPTFAYAMLYSCDASGNNCFFYAANANANAEGIVEFKVSPFGGGLPAGYYVIEGYANDYQNRRTDPFQVVEGQNYTLSRLRLTPRFPVQFSEIRPCGALPAEGGVCKFSARVNNASVDTITGGAWTVINASGLRSAVTNSIFQSGSGLPLSLARGASAVVQFRFTVPAGTANGATFCPELLVGAADAGSIDYYYSPIRRGQLFCISKGFTGGGFSIVTGTQGAALADQLDKKQAPGSKQH